MYFFWLFLFRLPSHTFRIFTSTTTAACWIFQSTGRTPTYHCRGRCCCMRANPCHSQNTTNWKSTPIRKQLKYYKYNGHNNIYVLVSAMSHFRCFHIVEKSWINYGERLYWTSKWENVVGWRLSKSYLKQKKKPFFLAKLLQSLQIVAAMKHNHQK